MILKNVKNAILSIGKSIDKPIFHKEFKEESQLLIQLENLREEINDKEILSQLNRDINMVKSGIVGEKNVCYELENSFLPIICLHDLYIEHEDYKAQIDFLIITSRFICILETKKLNGDIFVNENGDFIRSFKNIKGKVIKTEGIYSPITQNERHKKILKDMLVKNKIIVNCPVYSMVVMANPKSIVNSRYAPKHVKNQLVKYDQLSRKLKSILDKESAVEMSYMTIMDIAEYLNNVSKEKTGHYILDKYKNMKTNTIEKPMVRKEEFVVEEKSINKEKLIGRLKKFRWERSQADNVKPYFIFSNKQMEELIEKRPKCKEELLKVSGFGKVKSDKYGEEIIKILATCES
jgi:hypothetical protein